MKALFLLPALALLAACATPREQCVSRATQDLRIVDRLIAEGQTTLARGYGTERYQTTRPTWRQCGWYPARTRDGRIVAGAPRMCWDDEVITRTRPVAVDLQQESRTVGQLQAKRAQLARASNAAVAQCVAAYPAAR
ncbi:hypothetical protein [Falsirhodobacter halotolerans]|uniref:hypothetical protein n=1 Tax=Falsirhodobacter halotolerans TaxID=1146892 RepID=UPI001FD0841F|nr:hypothetical protein [Falsirhodobacter halotolerans]MCJ8140491.1 hypothetical protein [Falsirhodobacter halotolerans]